VVTTLWISLGVFVCLFCASLIGMRLRSALPGHHLNDDSRHLIEIGLGIIGTMAGLVLGLLVANATTSYNGQRTELVDISSKIILLDRLLAHYGPEANETRHALQVTVERALYRIWPKNNSTNAQLDPAAGGGEVLLDKTEALAPTTESQRSLKPQAIALLINLLQTRWLMFEQTGSSISVPLLIMLVFWFSITFAGFGIFAPPNPTVIFALALCSLAVSGAVFLMLEMYTPFQGLLQISSAPIRDALAHLGH
jgi:hypothetical protein